MFEYFPGNYVWNLSVVGALNSGGQIDEIDRACRPLLEAAKAGSDAGTNEFLRVWTDLTDALVESARVGGKPRIVSQRYLGPAEEIVARLAGAGPGGWGPDPACAAVRGPRRCRTGGMRPARGAAARSTR